MSSLYSLCFLFGLFVFWLTYVKVYCKRLLPARSNALLRLYLSTLQRITAGKTPQRRSLAAHASAIASRSAHAVLHHSISKRSMYACTAAQRISALLRSKSTNNNSAAAATRIALALKKRCARLKRLSRAAASLPSTLHARAAHA